LGGRQAAAPAARRGKGAGGQVAGSRARELAFARGGTAYLSGRRAGRAQRRAGAVGVHAAGRRAALRLAPVPARRAAPRAGRFAGVASAASPVARRRRVVALARGGGRAAVLRRRGALGVRLRPGGPVCIDSGRDGLGPAAGVRLGYSGRVVRRREQSL
jgi:hypothetical protein